jgi:hypothetical protein
MRWDGSTNETLPNEQLTQRVWWHLAEWFTLLPCPGLDATNWRAELAIRFGVVRWKGWGGNRAWAGVRAQSVLLSVWRTAAGCTDRLAPFGRSDRRA